jgi:hypothetical protein
MMHHEPDDHVDHYEIVERWAKVRTQACTARSTAARARPSS